MFKFPLALAYAKPFHKQQDPELQHLQADLDDWGKLSPKQKERTSKLSWLLKNNPHDERIKQAVKLIAKFGTEDIIAAHASAKAHKSAISNLSLMTVYMAKGKLN